MYTCSTGNLWLKIALFLVLQVDHKTVNSSTQFIIRWLGHTVNIGLLINVLLYVLDLGFLLFHVMAVFVGQQMINRLFIVDRRLWYGDSPSLASARCLEDKALELVDLIGVLDQFCPSPSGSPQPGVPADVSASGSLHSDTELVGGAHTDLEDPVA